MVPASSPSPADVSHSPSPVIQFPRSSSPLTAFRDIVKGILNVVNETEDFNELSAIQHPDDAGVTYCQDSLQPSLIEDSLRSPFTLLEDLHRYDPIVDSDDDRSTTVPEDQDVDDDLEEKEQLSEPSEEPNPAAEEPVVPAG